MPAYTTAALYAASFVLPTVVALGIATYGRGYARIFTGTLGVMLAIGINVGLAYYSYTSQPGWWNSNSGAFPLIVGAYIFVFFFGNIAGVMGALSLAEKIDKERLHQDSNVRRLRRSA